MSDLATRLREHVDTASPPVDVAALIEQLESDQLVMVIPPARRRFPDWASAFVVAAVVFVVIGGAALLFSGANSAEPADTIPPPTTVPEQSFESGPVFDLGADDLCVWFTAEDMNRILATAQQRVETDFEFVPFGDSASLGDNPGCWASVEDRSSTWGSAGWGANPAAEGSISVSLRSYFSWDAYVDREWFDAHPEWFDGHRLLDEAVGYHVSRHSVAYDAGVQIQLRVDGHEDILVFAFGIGDGAVVLTPKYEELGLAIANELLRKMNWIGD